MARTAAPSPLRGQHQRRKHGDRRSRSATAAITGLFLVGVMLLGTATTIEVSHLSSPRPAGRAAVRVKSPPPPSTYGLSSWPIIAAPTPKPTLTHQPRPRKQVPQAPRSSRSPVPTGVRGDWKLTFDDEFSGTSLDTAKWSTGWYGSGITPPIDSAEKDCYDPAQVSEGGGTIGLTLIRKSEDCGVSDQAYTTGVVTTRGKFNFTYGFIEARVWLPAVPGNPSEAANWPDVWADGQSWPEDGEIDIAEGLGGDVCAHFHGPDNPIGVGAGGPTQTGCPDGTYAGGWHVFGADWEPGIVTYYYDGADIGSVTSGITSAPMFLILSYASGDPYQAPATMTVDYMRVWQHP
jgi:beta-glucanase (GH16 family)